MTGHLLSNDKGLFFQIKLNDLLFIFLNLNNFLIHLQRSGNYKVLVNQISMNFRKLFRKFPNTERVIRYGTQHLILKVYLSREFRVKFNFNYQIK